MPFTVLAFQSVWAAMTKYHQLGGLYITEMLFFTVLEARSLRSGCQHGWIGENPLLGCRLPASHRVLTCLKESKLALWPVLVRALIPSVGAPPSQLNYLLKAPPPDHHMFSRRAIPAT